MPENENETKVFRFGDKYEGNSTLSVWCDGRVYEPDDEVYRPVYSYSIVTPKWRYDSNDIHGAANELPNVEFGSRSLFAFLLACAEAKDEDSENYDLFPPQVREWADHFSDQLSMEYAHMSE